MAASGRCTPSAALPSRATPSEPGRSTSSGSHRPSATLSTSRPGSATACSAWSGNSTARPSATVGRSRTSRSWERLAALADRLTRLTDGSSFDGEAAHDGSTYDRLREDCGLTDAAAARIDAALDRELDEATLREAVLGRSPHRDPHLPVTADLGTEK
ncbi:hypothetical protein BRC69_05445 [Halobacteriales archaeon QH_6_66_25]|nr:MAG: hypothetical protein BRC69_05445 [Halobacteriales archaeon QH_6_66_25]